MTRLLMTIRRLVSHETGQDLMEYGLLAALVAMVAMVERQRARRHDLQRLLGENWPGPLISSRLPRSSPAPAPAPRSICGRVAFRIR